jgi:uncharacterized protein (DUF849 family)
MISITTTTASNVLTVSTAAFMGKIETNTMSGAQPTITLLPTASSARKVARNGVTTLHLFREVTSHHSKTTQAHRRVRRRLRRAGIGI